MMAVLQGLEAKRLQIDEHIAELKLVLGMSRSAPLRNENDNPKKRTMSAAARKRISLAQKKRWADSRKRAAKKT